MADELHFRRTPERLDLTPSRVSQTIREVEHKLGAQLVHRTSRRVRLTAFGERLRSEARPAYEELPGSRPRLRPVAPSRHSACVSASATFSTSPCASGGGEVVHPTAPAAARVMGEHFDLAFVPITDLPPLSSALVWRPRTSNPRVREFIRIARDVLRDAQTSAKVSGGRLQQTSPPSQRQTETPQRS